MTLLPADDPATLDTVVDVLSAGTPVVLPTDTVYGLVARADDEDAVATIFDWKRRPAEQVMAVLVATTTQATAIGRFTATAVALAETFWPGPLTIVVERTAPLALGLPSPTVGVRHPASPLVAAVAARVGPLTATSANVHGRPTPTTAPAVLRELDCDVVAVDGGVVDGVASTVVNATGPDPQVLRVGPVSEAQLRAAIRP